MDRNNIINNYSKKDFSDFLTNDNTGMVLELLNDEGLDILNKSYQKQERITYILTFSNFRDELFKNLKFIDIFLNTDISYYYATLRYINYDAFSNLLKICFSKNVELDIVATLFSYANEEYKIKLLDIIPNDYNFIYALLNKESSLEVINKLLTYDDIDLTDDRLSLISLIDKTYSSVLKKSEVKNKNNIDIDEIKIPNYLINKNMTQKILHNNNIFKVRNILNKLELCINTDDISEYIKNYEDNIINKFDENTFLSPYKEIFISCKDMMNAENAADVDYYHTCRNQYIRLINSLKNYDTKNLHNKLQKLYEEKDLNNIFSYLKELSDRTLSNYIIDYHFEENYHNIIIDIQELLRFYYDGNCIISKEHVYLYEQVLNIDYLTINEKKDLYENLKKFNLKEMFYDDMKIARDIIFESITDASLDKETLLKFRDESLSKEMGVDVYKIDNEPFFGIVKTGSHPHDYLPTGHSFSLVGDNGVAVFGNVKNADTFLYDASELNKDQIVHAFPFDSFTLYKPFESVQESTNRVQPFMMPDEMTGLSPSYTEILILEKGRMQTDIDEKIPALKKIALYCIDEISEKDIETAKSFNMGIVLVNSKKYIENKKYYQEKFSYLLNKFDASDYTYFIDDYDQEKFENKR